MIDMSTWILYLKMVYIVAVFWYLSNFFPKKTPNLLKIIDS